MVLWMASIAVSVSILVIAAALGATAPFIENVHLLVSGLVSTAMALLAISETRKLINDGASQMDVAGSLMRYMGLIWSWSALVICITYGMGILEWSAWPQYFIGEMLVAGLCLFLSRVLSDNAMGGEDSRMLRISRYIAAATLLGSTVAAGIFGIYRINGLAAVEQDIWAAQHVFLFSALALAAISAYLLKASVKQAH